MEALRMKALGELLDLLSGMPIPKEGEPPAIDAPAEEKLDIAVLGSKDPDAADESPEEEKSEGEEYDITGDPEPITFKMKK